LVANQGF